MTTKEMMDELTSMGYSPATCQRALEVSGYDLEQAVGYLLMGEDSQQNFHDHHHDHHGQHGADDVEKDETNETVDKDPDALLPGTAAPNKSVDDVLPGVVVAVGNIVDGRASSDIDHLQRNQHNHHQQHQQRSTNRPNNKEEEELVKMGYSQKDAKEALKIAQGDITQAIGFLCMGESRNKFVVAHDESSNNYDDEDGDHDFSNDSAIAAALLEEDLRNQYHAQRKVVAAMEQRRGQHRGPSYNHQGTTHPQNYSTSSTPISAATPTNSITMRHSVKPKIVSSQAFLETKEALPFCICVCASKFLSGGVVSTTFFHSIMESGIELYRKESRKNKKTMSHTNNVGTVLRKYGKSSYLRISIVPAANDDAGDQRLQHGLFMEDDVNHGTSSIRQLLLDCRNQQGDGWRIVLIDLDNDNDNVDYDSGSHEAGSTDGCNSFGDSFCICLPPKGSTNKFWLFDFLPRQNVQTSGAYALVHSTLQHLEESIVLVFKTILAHRRRQHNSSSSSYIPFTFYQIQKIWIRLSTFFFWNPRMKEVELLKVVSPVVYRTDTLYYDVLVLIYFTLL